MSRRVAFQNSNTIRRAFWQTDVDSPIVDATKDGVLRFESMPPIFWILFATGLGYWVPGESEAKSGGVKIESTLLGRQIRWRVTNVDSPPIVSLEIHAMSVYHPTAPSGWSVDELAKGLRASANDASAALAAGQSAEFTLQGASSGTILAEGTARIGLANGQWTEVRGVRTLLPERYGTIFLVPAVITGLVVLHLMLSRRRRSLVV